MDMAERERGGGGTQGQDVKVENSIPAPVSSLCGSPPPSDKQRDSAAWMVKFDETHLSLLSLLSPSILWSAPHNKLTNLNWPSFTQGGTFLVFKYKQPAQSGRPALSTPGSVRISLALYNCLWL